MDLFNDIVWRSTLLLIWGGSVVAVLLGIGLLLAPVQTEKFNRYWSRRIDTSRMTKSIGKPGWLEKWIYRHHRIAGTVILFGSLYVLNVFLLRPGRMKIDQLAAADAFGLVDAVSVFFVITAVMSAFIGTVIAFKPSILRELEGAVNKSISLENLLKRFKWRDGFYTFIDEYVFHQRKISAVILISSGLYVCIRLGMVLLLSDLRL
ncbi:hypothetical protein [Noviherbaspirillum saxi]|uniref:Uncharacterized protein n=1 Tax=Noviherbaspirillum saxi TaxID=2320863 RepID=A0A3A3FW69_9BURK|nr:hypothetical protein [Noviherbaspirillum saxi]RJF98848.1 hypothetical protein D3871_10220 [Noviherbaspirillum saxi]